MFQVKSRAPCLFLISVMTLQLAPRAYVFIVPFLVINNAKVQNDDRFNKSRPMSPVSMDEEFRCDLPTTFSGVELAFIAAYVHLAFPGQIDNKGGIYDKFLDIP